MTITENIQSIICDSLRETAPLKTIQVDNKNSTKLSEESRIFLARRDAALDEMKFNPTIENIRDYKLLRNETNRTISKEKWKRKSANLQAEALSNNDKWKVAKKLTGQKKFNSPQLIIEGSKHHMSPKDMASGLNRLYIRKVRTVIEQIPPATVDPLTHYKQAIGKVEKTLSFQQLNMSQLVKLVDKMKPTGSSGANDISMRVIKDARNELQPLILKMINESIKEQSISGTTKRNKDYTNTKERQEHKHIRRVEISKCDTSSV